MSKKSRATVKAAINYAVSALESVDEEPDSAENRLYNSFDDAGVKGPLTGVIDSSDLTVEQLMNDKRVQKAFKKFCENVIGAVQFFESMDE